jgi:hypothetical protein
VTFGNTHVFLCLDTTRQALETPYQVLSWREKTIQLFMRRRPITVSTDRVKPGYIPNGTDCENNTFMELPWGVLASLWEAPTYVFYLFMVCLMKL